MITEEALPTYMTMLNTLEGTRCALLSGSIERGPPLGVTANKSRLGGPDYQYTIVTIAPSFLFLNKLKT